MTLPYDRNHLWLYPHRPFVIEASPLMIGRQITPSCMKGSRMCWLLDSWRHKLTSRACESMSQHNLFSGIGHYGIVVASTARKWASTSSAMPCLFFITVRLLVALYLLVFVRSLATKFNRILPSSLSYHLQAVLLLYYEASFQCETVCLPFLLLFSSK